MSTSVDAFRNFQDEANFRDHAANESAENVDGSKDTLASLYRLPFTLMFQGFFEQAKVEAANTIEPLRTYHVIHNIDAYATADSEATHTIIDPFYHATPACQTLPSILIDEIHDCVAITQPAFLLLDFEDLATIHAAKDGAAINAATNAATIGLG
ncbi:hypothetical protein L7F22_049233 [Adiantum nelumboides]|nr:hypothetical protein [Adiantum nelumboides]